MKALIDRLKKSNEFLNLFTLHNVFDADATDNIRRCILKNELAVDNCEKLVNEVSTIDEALPIDDVVKRYLAIGTLGSGKSFRYVDTADTMKCFVEYLNEIYPDFDIDAVIEV